MVEIALILGNDEKQLLERIAAEGKATRLLDEELALAKELEADGLLFLAGLTAIVTPKGRRLLAQYDTKPKRNTPPHKLRE
jgi:hypothetical protein